MPSSSSSASANNHHYCHPTASAATLLLLEEYPPTVAADTPQPVSRTYQYRKVMKPMLERKRRARINRCLDELKELMVAALQSDGENVNKLEKADILELTVRHLHKLRRQERLAANPVVEADRFRAGYTHCANEVSRCLAAIPQVDVSLGTQLMTHLGHRLNEMDQKVAPLVIQVVHHHHQVGKHVGHQDKTPPMSPTLDHHQVSGGGGGSSYGMPLTPASSTVSTTSSSAASSPLGSVHQLNPIDCSIGAAAATTTTGLLQMACKHQPETVWRPW